MNIIEIEAGKSCGMYLFENENTNRCYITEFDHDELSDFMEYQTELLDLSDKKLLRVKSIELCNDGTRRYILEDEPEHITCLRGTDIKFLFEI